MKFFLPLIVVGFILLTLMATNPSLEDHRQAVKEMALKEMEEKAASRPKSDNPLFGIVTEMGNGLVESMVNKLVSRENYLVFSTTKMKYIDLPEPIIVGYGVLGKVYMKDMDKLKENLSKGERDGTKDNAIGEINKDKRQELNSNGRGDGTIQSNVLKVNAISHNELPKGVVLSRSLSLDNINIKYIFDVGIEDEGVLYLQKDSGGAIYRVGVSDFDNVEFQKSKSFYIFKWAYDSNGECKSLNYKVTLVEFYNGPDFNVKLISSSVCAG